MTRFKIREFFVTIIVALTLVVANVFAVEKEWPKPVRVGILKLKNDIELPLSSFCDTLEQSGIVKVIIVEKEIYEHKESLDKNEIQLWKAKGLDAIITLGSPEKSLSEEICLRGIVWDTRDGNMILGREYQGNIKTLMAIMDRFSKAIIDAFQSRTLNLSSESAVSKAPSVAGLSSITMPRSTIEIKSDDGTILKQELDFSVVMNRKMEFLLADGISGMHLLSPEAKFALTTIDGVKFAGGKLPENSLTLKGSVKLDGKLVDADLNILEAWWDKEVGAFLILFQAKTVYWPVSPNLTENLVRKDLHNLSIPSKVADLPEWNSVAEIRDYLGTTMIENRRIPVHRITANGSDPTTGILRRLTLVMKVNPMNPMVGRLLPIGFIDGYNVSMP